MCSRVFEITLLYYYILRYYTNTVYIGDMIYSQNPYPFHLHLIYCYPPSSSRRASSRKPLTSGPTVSRYGSYCLCVDCLPTRISQIDRWWTAPPSVTTAVPSSPPYCSDRKPNPTSAKNSTIWWSRVGTSSPHAGPSFPRFVGSWNNDTNAFKRSPSVSSDK